MKFDIKDIMVVGLTAVAVAAAGLGIYHCCTKPTFESESQAAYDDLVHAYNDAVTEHPSNNQLAQFAFEAAAFARRDDIIAKYPEHPGLADWEAKYNKKVKEKKEAIRKMR